MSRLGCHIVPFLSYTNTSALDLEGFLAQRGELIFWATSSLKRKGSGEVMFSSAWWKCADAGVSLLTKISVKGETVPGKTVPGNTFVLGNKAEHPPNLLR